MRILPKGFVKFLNTPVVKIFVFICLMAGVFVAGIVWSNLDNVEQRRSYLAAVDQAARLSGKNADLEKSDAELSERIVQLEHKLQIDRVAYDKLTKTLNDSSVYISELRSDLDFYQSIISPEDNKPGVKVHEFTLVSTQNPAVFKYKLTVVQALNHDNVVNGRVGILLDGQRQGEPAKVSFEDIGGGSGKLRFRYFQNLAGEITLPDGLLPQQVAVNLDVKAGKKKVAQEDKVFQWNPLGNES